jgi:hypothetical protein
VIAACAIAGVSWFRMRFRASMERKRSDLDTVDAEGKVYEEILRAFEQMTATVISIVFVAVIAIADLLTPAQFNLPILYGVPLVICALTQKRTLLWLIVPAILFFTYAGYVIGPSASDGEIWGSRQRVTQIGGMTIRDPGVVIGSSELHGLPSLLTNRTLAACVILAAALLMHWWIGASRRARIAASASDFMARPLVPTPH